MKKSILSWIKQQRSSHEGLESLEAVVAPADIVKKRMLVLGNCQARSIATCLQALNDDVVAKGVEVPMTGLAERFTQHDAKLHSELSGYDCILAQPPFAPMIKDNFPDLAVVQRPQLRDAWLFRFLAVFETGTTRTGGDRQFPASGLSGKMEPRRLFHAFSQSSSAIHNRRHCKGSSVKAWAASNHPGDSISSGRASRRSGVAAIPGDRRAAWD